MTVSVENKITNIRNTAKYYKGLVKLLASPEFNNQDAEYKNDILQQVNDMLSKTYKNKKL